MSSDGCFTCGLACISRSRNKNSLREHMRTRHIQKPEACSICGKISANKKALMKHKRFHFAAAREKYKCQVCGHGFRDSTKLKVCFNKLSLFYISHHLIDHFSFTYRNIHTFTAAFRTCIDAHIAKNRFALLLQCMLIGKRHMQRRNNNAPNRSKLHGWLEQFFI